MLKRMFLIASIALLSAHLPAQDGKVKIFQGRRMPFMPNKIVDLSYGKLKEVPVLHASDEIEVLILDNNNLEHLPSWIGTLKKLRVLSVRNNNLVELSSKLSFCENLEQIYLNNNPILSDLPSLSFCRKLGLIDVTGTKINSIPTWVELSDSLFYFKYNEANPQSINAKIEISSNNSNQYTLSPGTFDIFYDLSGRSIIKLPSPKCDCKEGGRVVVEISVNRQGNVVHALPGVKGSTTLDESLLRACKEAASGAIFETNQAAPAIQKGTITYNY